MKSVVITGSSKGLGLAMGMFFLRNGCAVTFSGRRGDLGPNILDWLSKYDGKYQYVSCDVRNNRELAELFDLGAKRFGGVDIFINNAGVNTTFDYVYKTDPLQIEKVIETNLMGMINGTRIASKKMIEQGYGYIYNMEGLGSNGMIQEKTII
ncbi:MAG: SDR family oxidoreductase, partial [Clostridium sp.]|nr:SDR family oxidoreductase [Clostridium sp.]